MLLKPLTLAAASLSAATAFLLPPNVAPLDFDAIKASIVSDVRRIDETELLKLDCPGCPTAVKAYHSGKFRGGVNRHLELNFNIDHQPTHDRLLLNGFELYPNSDVLEKTLTAPQVIDFEESQTGQRMRKAAPFLEAMDTELGFGLEWRQVAKDSDSQMELVSVDFQIIEVSGVFVDDVPGVNVQLLKAANGALVINQITTIEPPSQEANPSEECATILCKWRAIVAEQLQRMKSHKCGKMAKMGHKGDHHHHGHHHPARPVELHEHSWKQLFKSFGHHILFPVLVGIAAGVSVSIIGMMVGTLVVGLWRVFVRGQPFFHRRSRRAGHAHHKAAQREASIAEEKSALMAAYEDEENKTAEA